MTNFSPSQLALYPPLSTYAESLDSGGNLTITQEIASANDNLSFTLSGGNYTFTDSSGLFFDAPSGANAADISGGGTSAISIPSAGVTSLSVVLGTGTNVFTFTGTSGVSAAPISVNTGSTAGDQVNITGAVLDSGAVTLTSTTISFMTSGSIAALASATIDLTSAGTITQAGTGTVVSSGTVDLTAAGDIGPLNIAASTLSATTSGGNIQVTNTVSTASTATLTDNGAGTVTFAQTGGGAVNVMATASAGITLGNTAADLTATSVDTQGDGTVLLSTTSSGSIALGSITATGQTVTVNSVGAITDTGPSSLLTADTATLLSASGIGASGSGNSINLAVNNVSATTTNSDVFLAETTGNLNITGVSPGTGSTTVSTANGFSLTVSGAIGSVTAGAVTLNSGQELQCGRGNHNGQRRHPLVRQLGWHGVRQLYGHPNQWGNGAERHGQHPAPGNRRHHQL